MYSGGDHEKRWCWFPGRLKRACHSCSAGEVCHQGREKAMVAEIRSAMGTEVVQMVRVHLSSLFLLGGIILDQTLTHSGEKTCIRR